MSASTKLPPCTSARALSRRMQQPLAGLQETHVRLVTHRLASLHAEREAEVFVALLDVLDCACSLVLKEMFSTRSETIYWERLGKSSAWEVLLTQWNSKIYRAITAQHELPAHTLKREFIQSHVLRLRAYFESLAVFLAKLHFAAEQLREVHSLVERAPREETRSHVCASLGLAVKGVYAALCEHLGVHEEFSLFAQLNERCEQLLSQETIPVEELQELCDTLRDRVYTLIEERSSMVFPLEVKDSPTAMMRRPSNTERYWVRNVLLALGTAYTCKTLVLMARDGSLQRHLFSLQELVHSKVTEHIVEPLTKLKEELFDTIRSKDHIVARDDLELSKAALERMLSDFSKSKEGRSLILPNLQVAKEEILKNKERLFTKEGVSDVVNAMKNKSDLPQIHTVESLRTGDPLVDLSPTPEQALVALMNEYEKDLQSPIKGILFGNLFTAILIQVQKLKVHTEVAMLKMDQILASNELTIAATAAMPAFAIFGFGLMRLKSYFTPKAQSGGHETMHLQLILSDVERSLTELEAIKDEPLLLEDAKPSRFFPHYEPLLWIARGRYYFHLVRLRSKFTELFHNKSLLLETGDKSTYTVAEYEIKQPRKNRGLVQDKVTNAMKSSVDLFQAVYTLLFGSNELLSTTTQHRSLDLDINLLESPDRQVPLALKMETAMRMRASYKILAPVHHFY